MMIVPWTQVSANRVRSETATTATHKFLVDHDDPRLKRRDQLRLDWQMTRTRDHEGTHLGKH